MATVDFTLEDLKKVFVTKDDLRGVVREELVRERKYMREMVEEVVTNEFASFWDHNLSPVLDEMLRRLGKIERV
jgi:glutamyl-tRNA reductase